jgi:hypothetical protein
MYPTGAANTRRSRRVVRKQYQWVARCECGLAATIRIAHQYEGDIFVVKRLIALLLLGYGRESEFLLLVYRLVAA